MPITRFYPSAHGVRQEISTNPNNLLNVQDGVCAQRAVTAGAHRYHDVITFKDSAGNSIGAIPAGSTLNHAYIGINADWAHNNQNLAVTFYIQKTGNSNVYGISKAGSGLACPVASSAYEVEVDAAHLVFTMDDYRTENFAAWLDAHNNTTGLSTVYVDAEWIKIDYTVPAVAGGMMDGLVCISMLKRLPRLPSFPLKNLFRRWNLKSKLHMPTVGQLAEPAPDAARFKVYVNDAPGRAVLRREAFVKNLYSVCV